jgi:tetratricopeptide (TPR) repeat protein
MDCRAVYEQAVSWLAAGRLEEAVAGLETVIARGGDSDPHVHLARFYRAEALARQGERAYQRGALDEAVAAFEQSFAGGVADQDRLLTCGAALLAGGRGDEAERVAATALALEPDTTEGLALLLLARIACQETIGDLPDRLAAHGTPVGDPPAPRALAALQARLEAAVGAAVERRRAAADLAAGRIETASERFAALLAADARDLKARAGLICIALRRQDAELACRLAGGLASGPGEPARRAALGRYLRDLGCGREASLLLATVEAASNATS